MDGTVIVMIVTLAMPNGEKGVNVKPMPDVNRCMAEAAIEASDPFVAGVQCSALANGELKLKFKPETARPAPASAVDPRSTG